MSQSNTLKIGITSYPVPGGSGVVASELGRLLASRGHEIHFISYAPPFRGKNLNDEMHFHQVEIPQYPLFKYPPYTVALASKMVEVSRQFELDILHVHYAVPHATAGFLAKSIMGNPTLPKLITTLHGTDITLIGTEKSFYEITHFSICASDAVTSVSEYLKRVTKSTFPQCTNVEVIPNFVDLTSFMPVRDKNMRRHFASDEELVLVHLSNFRPVKRPVDTIGVLQAINKIRPAQLLLIGDGPEMSLVSREAERLNIQDRVHMLGEQCDVQPLLACGDVFLLPSEQESFGLAALEALACGVPVVCYEVGGLSELIQQGWNGFCVPVADVNAMADKVLRLVETPEIREAYRLQARESSERFDANLVIPHFEEFYRRTLTHDQN